jgi:hypothetical protein
MRKKVSEQLSLMFEVFKSSSIPAEGANRQDPDRWLGPMLTISKSMV